MANNYAVAATQLTAGRIVAIRGKLGFARLTKVIDGDELAAANQRRVQNGMNPINQPFVTATITDAEVICVDPANPTLEEQFVAERRYSSKKNPASGPNYGIDSKSKTLPIIAIPSEAGDGTVDQDTSGRELASGLDVTLVLQVYKPKNFSNHGLRLDQVIVNEPPKYFAGGGGATKDELAKRGVVFNRPPKAVMAADASPVGEAPGLPADYAGGTDAAALPLPGPQPSVPVVQAQGPRPTAVPVTAVQEQPAVVPVVETPEEKLARFEAENARLKALQNAGSAVGEPAGSPWGDDRVGITYEG